MRGEQRPSLSPIDSAIVTAHEKLRCPVTTRQTGKNGPKKGDESHSLPIGDEAHPKDPGLACERPILNHKIPSSRALCQLSKRSPSTPIHSLAKPRSASRQHK